MITWLNNNNGFVMALLTFVYAITTILMYLSGRKSNKLVQQQFDKRLKYEYMPVLTVEKCDPITVVESSGYYCNCDYDEPDNTVGSLQLKINNIGNGIATKIAYDVRTEAYPEQSFEIDAESSINAGTSLNKRFDFIVKNHSGELSENADERYTGKTYTNEVGINIYYQDIIGNCYLKAIKYMVCTTYAFDGSCISSSVEIVSHDEVKDVSTPDILKNL